MTGVSADSGAVRSTTSIRPDASALGERGQDRHGGPFRRMAGWTARASRDQATSRNADSAYSLAPLTTVAAWRHTVVHAHRGHRRRSRRPVLRRAGQAARPAPTRSPSGSATPPTTPSASASSSPTRRSAASSTPTRPSTRAMQREFARWDDIDVAPPRHDDHLRRARLRRAEPQASCCGILQRAVRRARRRAALPGRGAGPATGCGRSTTWWSPPTGPSSPIRTAYADVFRPDLRDPPLQVHLAGRRPGLRRLQVRDRARRRTASCSCTATPTSRDASTFIVEMHDDVWRRAGFARRRRRGPAAGRERRASPSR